MLAPIDGILEGVFENQSFAIGRIDTEQLFQLAEGFLISLVFQEGHGAGFVIRDGLQTLLFHLGADLAGESLCIADPLAIPFFFHLQAFLIDLGFQRDEPGLILFIQLIAQQQAIAIHGGKSFGEGLFGLDKLLLFQKGVSFLESIFNNSPCIIPLDIALTLDLSDVGVFGGLVGGGRIRGHRRNRLGLIDDDRLHRRIGRLRGRLGYE